VSGDRRLLLLLNGIPPLSSDPDGRNVDGFGVVDEEEVLVSKKRCWCRRRGAGVEEEVLVSNPPSQL